MKCLPVHLYGVEVRPVSASLSNVFMKLFQSNHMDTIKHCLEILNCELPCVSSAKHVGKFRHKLQSCNNILCKRIFKILSPGDS